MKLYLEDNKIEKCINYKCKSKKKSKQRCADLTVLVSSVSR